ncbi:MAG: prepilin peptidase [Clostridia bacterium]|nr:prepilin peptidase [Clostridia bacterium]
MFEIFWLIVALIYGMVLGSFTNVCIYRIPEGTSLWSPPSTCPKCGYQLKWYDNIPVLSYLILGGKCRKCKTKISVQYPLVEAATGILVALIYLKLGLTPDVLFLSIILVILLSIAVIDYKTMIIPNGTVISLIVVGLLYTIARLIFPQVFAIPITWLEALIGFFAASVPLFLVAVLSKGGMGGGDIKLMAAAGIFLGWKGIILAMIVGSVIGAVVSLTLIALKRKKRKDLIPFGPFLCLGILVAAVLGPEIIQWYTGLFTVFQ